MEHLPQKTVPDIGSTSPVGHEKSVRRLIVSVPAITDLRVILGRQSHIREHFSGQKPNRGRQERRRCDRRWTRAWGGTVIPPTRSRLLSPRSFGGGRGFACPRAQLPHLERAMLAAGLSYS